MTKIEAIKELKGYDHCFLTEEGAEEICKPFGLKPLLYLAKDNRSQFKGLKLNGINPTTGVEFVEGDKAKGQDAHRLACYIADKLGVEYQEMFGIGSQLRSACEAIEKSLS